MLPIHLNLLGCFSFADLRWCHRNRLLVAGVAPGIVTQLLAEHAAFDWPAILPGQCLAGACHLRGAQDACKDSTRQLDTLAGNIYIYIIYIYIIIHYILLVSWNFASQYGHKDGKGMHRDWKCTAHILGVFFMQHAVPKAFYLRNRGHVDCWPGILIK